METAEKTVHEGTPQGRSREAGGSGRTWFNIAGAWMKGDLVLHFSEWIHYIFPYGLKCIQQTGCLFAICCSFQILLSSSSPHAPTAVPFHDWQRGSLGLKVSGVKDERAINSERQGPRSRCTSGAWRRGQGLGCKGEDQEAIVVMPVLDVAWHGPNAHGPLDQETIEKQEMPLMKEYVREEQRASGKVKWHGTLF